MHLLRDLGQKIHNSINGTAFTKFKNGSQFSPNPADHADKQAIADIYLVRISRLKE